MLNFKGIIDTTLREGQQSPLLFDSFKYFFTLEEKKQILRGLLKLGIEMIEFFSLIVSQKEPNDFIKIKKYLSSISKKKIVFLSHCRCREEDIKLSLSFGFNGLNLYMGFSDHAQKVYGKNIKELILQAEKLVSDIRKKYPKIYLRFSAEDAFRTPVENIYLFMIKFINMLTSLVCLILQEWLYQK